MIKLTFNDHLLAAVYVNPANIVSFFEFNGCTHVFTVITSCLDEDDEGIVVKETPEQISRLIAQSAMYHGTASL
tara:strand:+ start:141 stop:362 length:222 start_codon:yes stop_codon:yes gene_type:complete